VEDDRHPKPSGGRSDGDWILPYCWCIAWSVNRFPPSLRTEFFRTLRSSRLDCLDLQFLEHHIFVRAVIPSACNFGDLIDDILPLDDFTKNGVLAGQP
jgi:hypothetical protein